MKLLVRFSACAVGLAAILLGAAPSAVAVTPAPNVIYGCVGDFAQFVRIVKAPKDCVRGEKLVQWNVMGIAGLPGPQGAPGMPGANGAPGLPGAQGLPGAKGPAGVAGSVGPVGPAGSPGAQGPIGAVGPAGSPGTPGAAGVVGPSGPTGPVGPAGPEGPAGATTLPANLTTLSNLLTRDPNANSGGNFTDGNGGTCTLGDILLSVNNYNNGNYVPADGSLYAINTHTAVFSLLGTRFGGDGVTNFAVPNIQAAAPSGLYYNICFLGVFPPRN